MNIGRTPLSHVEFNRLWSILYQEFLTLSSTGTCNAACVYSTIYRICTSTVSYEDKLYWKIGDFLHNRCKEHQERIIKAANYLDEYAQCFQKYEMLVKSIHKLGCFLNECVHGRKLDDFGFLLWERSVIQTLPLSFFEDVYNYSGPTSTRTYIIASFATVIPDPASPFLYYKEKYERLALEKIKASYTGLFEEDVLLFSEQVRNIVEHEKSRFPDFFLPSSKGEHEHLLSDVLFSDSIGFIFRIKAFLENSIQISHLRGLPQPVKRFSIAVGMPQKNRNSSTQEQPLPAENAIVPVTSTSSTHLLASSHAHSIIHPRSSFDRTDDDSNLIGFVFNTSDDSIIKMAVFTVLAPLINKKYLTPQINVPENSSKYCQLLVNLSSLPQGIVILKRAYICYLIETLNNAPELLSGDIPIVYETYKDLDFFNIVRRETVTEMPDAEAESGDAEFVPMLSEDFNNILIATVKFALQRIKPCFITRLSQFSGNLTAKRDSTECDNAYPFIYSDTVFRELVNFVSDKREFLNVYHTVLKGRLLFSQTDLEREREMLDMIGVGGDNRLYKVIDDIKNNQNQNDSTNRFLLLNYNYWNIGTESPHIQIPEQLIEQLKEYHREMNREITVSERDNLLVVKMYEDGDIVDKMVQISHQHSSVVVEVGNTRYVMSIMQYTVVDALQRVGTVSAVSEATKLDEGAVNSIIGGLMEEDLVVERDGVLVLASPPYTAETKDISKKRGTTPKIIDVCRASYLQALIAGILKTEKKVPRNTLLEDVKRLSRIDVTGEEVLEAIDALAEKSLCDIVGDSVEYI